MWPKKTPIRTQKFAIFSASFNNGLFRLAFVQSLSACHSTARLGQSDHVGITSGCTVMTAGWHEFSCEDPLAVECVLPDAVWLRPQAG
jgi:hypothetical protein